MPLSHTLELPDANDSICKNPNLIHYVRQIGETYKL